MESKLKFEHPRRRDLCFDSVQTCKRQLSRRGAVSQSAWGGGNRNRPRQTQILELANKDFFFF